ncbi:MAG: tetratricopeptide repeat protein [Fidelibacterota bacterium]|nr:MAG: tetratricopeptide repeat protein [Candidatus Neomarinimicrobiota bacterium]
MRKLAAIMFTDIVGYTALMGEDESKALGVLQKNRKFLKPFIEQFNGEWLKEMGDGSLSSFGSAVDAVNCALEIQHTLVEEPELTLRIGLHVGDVIFEGGDVFGDGVNVASRIESLAEPGGICFSGRVYEDIRNKPDVEALYLGEKQLKNVKHPLKVYALKGKGLPVPAIEQVTIESDRSLRSIAVLPLMNLTAKPEEDWFADGMTEALITSLARISALKVISRTSVMPYKGSTKSLPQIAAELGVQTVIEGSVLKSDNRVRITAQLIEAQEDRHIWADEYDRDLTDILALHSEVAQAIAKEVNASLTPDEEAGLKNTRSVHPEAYQLYLRGLQKMNLWTESGLRIGIDYHQRVLDIDPTYAPAWAELANCYSKLCLFGYSSPKDAFPKAKQAAVKALEIDPALGDAHAALGAIKMHCEWDWVSLAEHFRQSRRLIPNGINALLWEVQYLVMTGRFDQGIEVAERATEIDPLAATTHLMYGWSYFMARKYPQAARVYRKVIELDPEFAYGHLELGWTYFRQRKYIRSFLRARRALKLGDSQILLGTLGYGFGMMKMKKNARKLLTRLTETYGQSWIDPLFVGIIHWGIGEVDQAFEWFLRGIEQRSPNMVHIKHSPFADGMKDDPRYQDLLHRMNFPE